MSDSTLAAELDFSLYRKPELAEKISSLLSLPGVLKTIFKCGAAVVLATWILLAYIYATAGNAHWSWHVFLCIYGTMAGALCGVLLGGLVALNRALDHLIDVFDVTLEVTEQATRDLADLRQGDKKMPTTSQMLIGVHDHVLLPMVEGVVRGQSRWLAWLIFPIYRWTLRGLLGRVLKFLEKEEAATASAPDRAAEDVEIQLEVESTTLVETEAAAESPAENESHYVRHIKAASVATLNTVSSAVTSATALLTATRSYVTRIGRGVRVGVMTPLSILFSLVAIIAAIPVILVWWLTG